MVERNIVKMYIIKIMPRQILDISKRGLSNNVVKTCIVFWITGQFLLISKGAGLDTKASAEDKQCGWSNTFCTGAVPNLHFWRWRDCVRFLYPCILNSIEMIMNASSSSKSSWHVREGLNGFFCGVLGFLFVFISDNMFECIQTLRIFSSPLISP